MCFWGHFVFSRWIWWISAEFSHFFCLNRWVTTVTWLHEPTWSGGLERLDWWLVNVDLHVIKVTAYPEQLPTCSTRVSTVPGFYLPGSRKKNTWLTENANTHDIGLINGSEMVWTQCTSKALCFSTHWGAIGLPGHAIFLCTQKVQENWLS